MEKQQSETLNGSKKREIPIFNFLLLFLRSALCGILTVLFTLNICTGQSLIERKQQQIQKSMIENTPAWDRLQELKFLRDNNPAGAAPFNYYINETLQWYNPENRPYSSLSNDNSANTPKVPNAKGISDQHNNNAFAPKFEDPNKNNKNKNRISPSNTKSDGDFLTDYLNGIARFNRTVEKTGYYDSERYKTDLSSYQNAFNKFKDMLEDKIPLSLADAFYIEEAAYGNLHMSYKEYKEEIARCAAFITQWMQENGLNPQNPEQVHLAIQKFMGDTLQLKESNFDKATGLFLPKGHKPYSYDYIDYKAEEDLHNYFLTKSLATGTGQCNTLPRVYAVIAEAMGVNVSISFVHQHSFIKYKNNDGTIQNYEPTIDWHMSDNDYTEDMPVMTTAISNKIYLQPLTKKQMIASIMIDLSYNFYREHWTVDGKFMNQCLDYAMKYFHNGVGHREGLLLKNLVLASQLDKALYKNGISDLNDIEKSPEALLAYTTFRKSSDRIKDLGIQQYPDEVYNAMLEKHDTRGKLQIAKKIDTKSKKSLFFNF